MPVESLDPKNKRVSLVYNLSENEIAYLNRLEFRGNIFTKDKVIRREMILREGDRFSLAMFKDSLLRIKQLGLVDVEKDPDIKPDGEDPTKINATVNVKELQRNNIQFSAGLQRLRGLLCRRQLFDGEFPGGRRERRGHGSVRRAGSRIMSWASRNPIFWTCRSRLGFNLYSRYIDLPYLYARKDVGADIILGARLRGYIRGNLTYSYSNISLSESDLYGPGRAGSVLRARTMAIITAPRLTASANTTSARSSRPSTGRRSTAPSRRTRGMMYLLSAKFAGGPLGGEVDFIKPRVEFTHLPADALPPGLRVSSRSYEFIRTGEELADPLLGEILPRGRARHPGLRDLLHRPAHRRRLPARRGQVPGPELRVPIPDRRARST